MQSEFDLGDRKIGLGHNGGPALDDEEDDKSPPTPEEARLTYQAIAYVIFKCPDLEGFMEKKKGKLKLGWRDVVLNALKHRVRQNSLHKLLKINRKTIGENQKRPDMWAEADPEFEEMLARVRDAIQADSYVEVEPMNAKLKELVAQDAAMAAREEAERLRELALDKARKQKAEAAAEAADDEREKELRGFAKTLKKRDVPNAEALLAEHWGPRITAKKMSKEALAALGRLISKKAKHRHPKASEMNAAGLAECVRLGLARDAEPHLSKATDRQHGPTAFGAKVYATALVLGLVELKPSRKKQGEPEVDLISKPKRKNVR